MAISVKSNVVSLTAQRNLNRTMSGLRGSIEKLSSGYRINSAADDAAGLAIAESMTSSMKSLQVASRNANDAVSMLQTAETGADDITGMLQRMRELAMQASSDGVTDTERDYIQTEVDELITEIDRVAGDTEYNGTALLDGTLTADFQVGLDSGQSINIAVSSGLDTTTLSVDGVDLTAKATAQSALADIDAALEDVNDMRAGLGAKQNRLDVVSNNISSQYSALADAHSRIRDVDIAQETANMTKNQILLQAGAAMLAQANTVPQIALSLLG